MKRYLLPWLLLFTLMACALPALAGGNAAASQTPAAVASPTGPASVATATVEATATLLPTALPPGIPASELFELPWEDRSPFKAGLQPGSQPWVDDLPQASLYRVELTIPDAVDVLSGRQEIVYTNQEDHPLADLVFRLFANINGGAVEIDRMRINGQAVQSGYENNGSVLRAVLPAPLEPGEQVFIQMDFSITIPRLMGGNYGLFGYFDDVLMLDLFLPTIPVFDKQGWYVENAPRHGDLSYYDASFYLVRVTAPPDFVLVASGVETGREEDTDRQVVTLAIGPARDFTLAASANFTVQSAVYDGVQVNSYAVPGEEDGQALALEAGGESIKFFSELIGPYDYIEFDVASTPMQAGGIEYPGMTWINQVLYDLEGASDVGQATGVLRSVTSHEAAHQWFYNMVGNNQVDEPWLDESLVQYVNGLFFREEYGQGPYESLEGTWYDRWSRIDFREMPIGMPSADYTSTEYVAAVYGRGPFFFQALSERMGEEAFNRFLRAYFAEYHWEIAQTEDIRAAAEAECSCNLEDLFDDWVYPQD